MSTTYDLLRTAHQEARVVHAVYHDKTRIFEVRSLGHTEGVERCHAFQFNLEPPDWRCFNVEEIHEASLGSPLSDYPAATEERQQGCVATPDPALHQHQ